MNWSVKIYRADVKGNRKTINRASVIEEIVTQNRLWCNRQQLSPCSNRDYEMWSIRYSRYTSNRDSTTWDIAARFGHVNILITRHTSVWLDTDKVWPQTINPKHYLWHSKSSFPTSKKKRNFTSHSWNCDDAKGRIQNECYIVSSSLSFFCHSTDIKTTVCQNANLFWVQQSKMAT